MPASGPGFRYETSQARSLDALAAAAFESDAQRSEEGPSGIPNPHIGSAVASSPTSHSQSTRGPMAPVSLHLTNDPAMNASHNKEILERWCEALGNKYKLQSSQYSDLLEMAHLGLHLDLADMQMRLYLQATTLHSTNLLASQLVSYQEYRAVMQEVQAMLGANWGVSEDQKSVIRIITRDFIFQANRTTYMQIHIDVEAHLRTNATTLGFTNVYGNPQRERVVMGVCKDIGSNVRNQYRKSIVESVIDGDKRCALEQATFQMATTFKTGGPGTALAADFQIRIALHRRWAFENIWQLSEGMQAVGRRRRRGADADDSEPSDPEDIHIIEGPNGPVRKRKRIEPTVGKVLKGHDFWSRVEQWWVKQMEQWGNNYLQSELWREYITSTIDKDRMFFGTTSVGYPLAPLPVKYQNSPAAALEPSPVETSAAPYPVVAGVTLEMFTSPAQRSHEPGLFGSFMGAQPSRSGPAAPRVGPSRLQ